MIGQMLCKQEFYRGDDWADAVYHRVCSANFRTMKQIPAIHEHEDSSLKKLKVGRRPEKQRADAFLEVARFLEENDDELRMCIIKILFSDYHINIYPNNHDNHYTFHCLHSV